VSLKRGYYDAVDTNFIVDLLNLPWFHRTWPIQELVLASTIYLLYGDLKLLWSDFINSLKRLQANELWRRWLRSSSCSNPASYHDDTECHRTLTDLIRGSHRSPAISMVLGTARSKLSTQPEDKVYGLYGIFDHLQIKGLPEVDYARPVHETYIDIAIAAIKSEESLDLLYHVSLPPLVPNLPSWVPDWSNAAYFHPILIANSHASESSVPYYSVSGRRLSVKGFIINSIHHIAPSTSIALSNFRRGYNARMNMFEVEKRCNGVIELVRTLQEWIKLSDLLNRYPTGITAREALYRVVAQNAVLGPLVDSKQELYTTLEQWCFVMTHTSSLDLQKLHQKVKKVLEYEATVADYSRLFGVGSETRTWPTELQKRLFLRLVSPDVALVQHEIFLNSYHKTYSDTRGACGELSEVDSGRRSSGFDFWFADSFYRAGKW
jgi:hypothetical protein